MEVIMNSIREHLWLFLNGSNESNSDYLKWFKKE